MPPECEEIESGCVPEQISCIDSRIKEHLWFSSSATLCGANLCNPRSFSLRARRPSSSPPDRRSRRLDPTVKQILSSLPSNRISGCTRATDSEFVSALARRAPGNDSGRFFDPRGLRLCRGRRAMVNKLWCQEVARKWFHKKEEPPHPRFLTEPKCQRHVATWYLLYRWLIFLAWACIIACSIFELGSYEPNVVPMYDKWPIYLTNWDLMLGVSQALLGGYLVSRRWRQQKVSDSDPSKLGFIDRVYWFLYVVTTNTALVVTITYWCSIYDPSIHYLDPLNVMLHICNTILMILDYCVTSIPFRLRNFWWSLTVVFVYVTFSIIYYLAGGLDKNGYHYIYKILDWKKPVSTTFVCVGQAVFITIVHSLMCFLENIKNKLYLKVDRNLGRAYAETQACNTEKRANVV